MTGDTKTPPETQPLVDRSDERVRVDSGISGALRGFWDKVRSGDLGALPVVVGLAIIWTVFQGLNPIFLSSDNLDNLVFDASTVGVISLGIVCVLMVGEIDLSVGSISGLASGMLGALWVNHGWPIWAAVLAALAVAGVFGYIYATLLNRLGMPSFVSSLAGLLAILGFQLYILGATGSINLPYGSPIVNFGQNLVMPHWLAFGVVMLAGIVILAAGLREAQRRQLAGLSANSRTALVLRALVITALLTFVVYYLDLARGVPWMFAFFVGLVLALNYCLTRTKWGRSMAAVGGNREAARRSGIKVDQIYTSAFIACAVLAALGGMLSAVRLATSTQQAGTGDVNLNAIAAAVIGGTSLFGGRGTAYSALLGIIVIQSISSGLSLLDLSSAPRYMITGAVLAIAVIVDSIAKRSRISHGRA